MAIARLWQSGSELNQWDIELTWRASSNFTISTVKFKSGLRSYRSTASTAAYQSLGSSTAQCRLGGFLNHGGSQDGLDTPYIFSFADGGTAVLSLVWDEPNSLIKLFAGTQAQDLLASASDAAFTTQNAWYHIGFDIKINATGWAYVYIDGVETIAFSGDTTLRASDVNRLYIGGLTSPTDPDKYWGPYAYWDNLYVDDTVGEGAAAVVPSYRFTLLNPNGNGYSSDFNGSDGNQTDNYLLVDEVPHDGDTTYVYQNVAAENDGYLLDNISLAAGESVVAVLPIAVAKKIDAAGSLTLDLGERLSGVNQVSSPSAPGTDYTLLWERHTTKPGGGAWDESDVNSAEVVLETV